MPEQKKEAQQFHLERVFHDWLLQINSDIRKITKMCFFMSPNHLNKIDGYMNWAYNFFKNFLESRQEKRQ